MARDLANESDGRPGLLSGRGLLLGLVLAGLFAAVSLFLPLPSKTPLATWLAPAFALVGLILGLVLYRRLASRGSVEPSVFLGDEAAPEVVAADEVLAGDFEAVGEPGETGPLHRQAPGEMGMVHLVERFALALENSSAPDRATPQASALRDELVALVPDEPVYPDLPEPVSFAEPPEQPASRPAIIIPEAEDDLELEEGLAEAEAEVDETRYPSLLDIGRRKPAAEGDEEQREEDW